MSQPKAMIAVFAYGGVNWLTQRSVIQELAYVQKHKLPGIRYVTCGLDAAIDRARGILITAFLEQTQDDVVLMIDHDISWMPGDCVGIINRAHELGCPVSGLVSKRRFSGGFGCSIPKEFGPHEIGSDVCVPVDQGGFVGGAFLAIPRICVKKMIAHHGVVKCRSGQELFYPLFMPNIGTLDTGEKMYLSEDWAFSFRAQEAGCPPHIDLKPQLMHTGDYSFSAYDGNEVSLS